MYKLLIVDDEREIRNGYSKYFPWEQLGFEVVGTSEDGVQALDFMSTNPVDVVICDIVMPNLNGIELTTKIHELHPHIKVVVLSGYNDFEYARKAFCSGAFDYVLKSDKHSILIQTMEKIKKQLDLERSVSLPPPTDKEDLDLVEKAKKYIRSHFKTVTLNSTADHIKIGPNYLSKIFKEKTGINFYSFVLEVKLEQAKKLLKNPNIKILNISDEIGYSNPKNFNRVFKRMVGLNPSDYRNQQLKIHQVQRG